MLVSIRHVYVKDVDKCFIASFGWSLVWMKNKIHETMVFAGPRQYLCYIDLCEIGIYLFRIARAE
jgi:hypothetical protein